jgi:hypothetical protein
LRSAPQQDKGEEDPANEQEEKQPAPRAIAIPIVKRQRLRVNFVNRDVDVDVVRVVMNDAYPLMFSVAEFLATIGRNAIGDCDLPHTRLLALGIA